MKQSLKKTPARILSCCLALIALNATLLAKPRLAAPPMPESHLQLWRFDTAAEFTGTNKGPADVSGVTSSESWSGYSLRVAGEKSARIAFPEINAAGKTNLAFNHGAVRLWFRGDWSSAGLGGKGPGSDARLLSLHSAAKAGVIERALVFDPSGDSLYCADVNGEQLFQAKIGWQAGTWHQVVLNYSAQGTALFLDGELVAKGQGVAAWPKAAGRFFTLGSDSNGENLAQGEFEEFTTFARNLRPEEIGANYRAYAPVALLGPITPEEEAAKKEHQAKLIAARKSGAMQMSLAPPGGGGGGGTNGAGGGYSYLTAQTGLRLVDPAWQSNVFTATIAGGEEGGRYDLFFTTNLSVTNAWSFMTRTAPGQTNLLVAPADPGFFLLGTMLDADGDTLTDAYEALVSKTSPASPDTFASLGGTGTTALLVFDEPAVVRISQVNIHDEFVLPCPNVTIPPPNHRFDLNWTKRLGGYSTNQVWADCPSNLVVLTRSFWDSNGVATCDYTTNGTSFTAGTNCPAPPTNWPAEFCAVSSRTAVTKVELYTGGKAFSQTPTLFIIHVVAFERTNTTTGLKATNIMPSEISVLNQALNTNGDLHVLLRDRQTFDITPSLSTNYSNYVFTTTITYGKLLLKAGTNNLTGTTFSDIAGAKFTFDCVLENSMAPITNYQWLLSSNVVDNWEANSATGKVVSVSSLTNSSVSFAWIAGGTNDVSCTVMVAGVPMTAKTTFIIEKANWKIFALAGTVYCNSNYNQSTGEQWVHYGNATNTPGITFTPFHISQSGDIRWIQIATENRRVKTNGVWRTQAGSGLDGPPGQYFYPIPTASTNAATSDSPGLTAENKNFSGVEEITTEESYDMFMMFKPSVTNSIWIPLRKIHWTWQAGAYFTNGVGALYSSSNPNIAPSDADATTYPIWTNRIDQINFKND